jgi:hypothetical protein
MKIPSRLSGVVSLLLLFVVCGVGTANAARVIALGSSSSIPAAEGQARLNVNHNGNVAIDLRVKHLAPPGRIAAGAEHFVVWVRGLAPGAEAQNLGALKVSKDLNGRLRAVTPMKSFDLFITCEESQTALVPSQLELLPLHYSND